MIFRCGYCANFIIFCLNNFAIPTSSKFNHLRVIIFDAKNKYILQFTDEKKHTTYS